MLVLAAAGQRAGQGAGARGATGPTAVSSRSLGARRRGTARGAARPPAALASRRAGAAAGRRASRRAHRRRGAARGSSAPTAGCHAGCRPSPRPRQVASAPDGDAPAPGPPATSTRRLRAEDRRRMGARSSTPRRRLRAGAGGRISQSRARRVTRPLRGLSPSPPRGPIDRRVLGAACSTPPASGRRGRSRCPRRPRPKALMPPALSGEARWSPSRTAAATRRLDGREPRGRARRSARFRGGRRRSVALAVPSPDGTLAACLRRARRSLRARRARCARLDWTGAAAPGSPATAAPHDSRARSRRVRRRGRRPTGPCSSASSRRRAGCAGSDVSPFDARRDRPSFTMRLFLIEHPGPPLRAFVPPASGARSLAAAPPATYRTLRDQGGRRAAQYRRRSRGDRRP